MTRWTSTPSEAVTSDDIVRPVPARHLAHAAAFLVALLVGFIAGTHVISETCKTAIADLKTTQKEQEVLSDRYDQLQNKAKVASQENVALKRKLADLYVHGLHQ